MDNRPTSQARNLLDSLKKKIESSLVKLINDGAEVTAPALEEYLTAIADVENVLIETTTKQPAAEGAAAVKKKQEVITKLDTLKTALPSRGILAAELDDVIAGVKALPLAEETDPDAT